MPRVTVIVRSMGRPLLEAALRSIARQDHSAIEVVVVDATGGDHPPLPEIAWRGGHAARLVGTGQRLQRPQAANVGLDHVGGEFFCWLDDDDTYESGHVAALLAQASRHPEALAVYGQAIVCANGVPTGATLGQAFNRALMHYGPLFHPSAALFRRRAITLGCRFDERFELCEDRDFVAQVAEHSDLVYLPSASFNYASDLGSSGTGSGANRDAGRRAEFEALLRAKWAGPRTMHTERAASFCRRGVDAYAAGRRNAARQAFERCLALYPGDPSALHGLARLALDDGDFQGAEAAVRQALTFSADSHEFRLTLATALSGQGRTDEAVAEARYALGNPRLHAAARALLARIAPAAANATDVPSRLAPCPCGSGKRYRDCCGRIGAAPAPADRPLHPTTSAEATASADPVNTAIRAAIEAFRDGEALQAQRALDHVDPDAATDASAARQAGGTYLALGGYRRASAFLRRAVQLDASTSTLNEFETACAWMFKASARESLQTTLQDLVRRIDSTRSATPPGQAPSPAATEPGPRNRRVLHLVATLANIGGAERRVLELHDLLAPHADVRLWSANGTPRAEYAARHPITVLGSAPDPFPGSGTVLFSGQHFDWGEWLTSTRLDRVVVCYNLDQPEELVRRLVALVDAGWHAHFDFTFPSALTRDVCGLSGEIERGLVDTRRFHPAPDRHRSTHSLVVGRHSRDHPLKHHPNDPSFFRRVAASGHRVRLLGGMPLASALARGTPAPGIELLPANAVESDVFLRGLDCFVYRKHPQLFETGGTVIYEAMATGLPVVAFAGECGALEVVESGRNGFVVDSEDEALDVIERLARDAALCRQVGLAARETIVALMAGQREAALRYYLDGTASAAR